MKTSTIDARHVRSFDDFVRAMNVGHIEHLGGSWNGNLDAFNDYLSWSGDDHYELVLLGAEACARHLGHQAQAAWLREHLETCHPANVPALQARLTQAEAGKGETLFDVVLKIIADNRNVRLVLR